MSVAGEDIRCPSCGERTIVPRPVARVTRVPSGITVPLLVSAIGNICVGLLWLSTCFGVVLTVPMAILCIFEFMLYAKAQRLGAEELAAKATTIAIFEIILGLFNIVSLVCGIIVLVHVSQLREAASSRVL